MNKKSIAMPIALVITVLALVATAFWGYTQYQQKEALEQQLRDRNEIALKASGVEDVINYGDFLGGRLGGCSAKFVPTEDGWDTKLTQFPAIGDNTNSVKLAIDYTSINDLSEDVAMLCYGGGKYDFKEKVIQSPY